MSHLRLPISAETESDANDKTLLSPDGTRYVGGVKDGVRASKAHDILAR